MNFSRCAARRKKCGLTKESENQKNGVGVKTFADCGLLELQLCALKASSCLLQLDKFKYVVGELLCAYEYDREVRTKNVDVAAFLLSSSKKSFGLFVGRRARAKDAAEKTSHITGLLHD